MARTANAGMRCIHERVTNKQEDIKVRAFPSLCSEIDRERRESICSPLHVTLFGEGALPSSLWEGACVRSELLIEEDYGMRPRTGQDSASA